MLEALGKVLEAFSEDAPGGVPLALLPALPPYQAIDVALSIQPDRVEFASLPETFRPAGSDPEARKRFLYLEGSVLAKIENYPGSIEKLDELVQLDSSNPEPILRLAEVLRLAGQPERAEKALRSALEDTRGKDRRLWDLWLAVELVD